MKWTQAVFFLSLFSLGVTAESDGVPSLEVMARSSVYNVGENKVIYCKGLNLPERIEWYAPNREIVGERSSANSRIFSERLKNDTLASSLVLLFIRSFKIEDSGNWTCKAGDLFETIQIIVGERVSLSATQETFEGEETKSARFDCAAKGYPPPVFQWYKDNTPIVADGKKFFLRKKEDNYQLEIRNLSHQDTGEYTCKVTQKALSHYAHKRVLLNVQHKPFLYDEFDNTRTISYSRYRTEEVYAIINAPKNITCRAVGYPEPKFEWFRRINGHDDPITDEDMIANSQDGSSSTLMLRMYDEEALGEYKCLASNEKGRVYVIYHVQKGNKPDMPDHVSVVGVSTTSITFNVTCSTCNMAIEEDKSEDPQNLTVLGYTFQLVPYKKGFLADWNSSEEFDVDFVNYSTYPQTLFIVEPLANKTTYHVRVCTRNSAGCSDFLELSSTPTTAFAGRLFHSFVLMLGTLLLLMLI
ncbi:neural cell adhesion molecule 2-like isoform X2 [Maniola hyperantus]|uniref:neural cell adhesion molecule 2-like isoform X2 n=1 Tax=Aphantopus hyperantus TaxID=2795564 RepID=UPI00156A4963|nr:obscurin-like isoform X1 [Maniola hyperantus]